MKFLYCLAVTCSVFVFCSCEEIDPPENTTVQQQQPTPVNAPPGNAAPEEDKSGILGKTTAEIVDAKKAMSENPNLKVMETTSLGGDPLTQGANAAIYIPSRILMLNMQNTLKQFRALNDRWPNYAEFMDIVKQNNIQFNMLKRWQMYGYDSEKGEMLILQDEAKKKAAYEKAGIDYEPGKL
ncbi:MAG: hypothetical protein HUJ26_24660 [Planctomycetaceae bacterium]|nr:hypothetical protein [Planctomycetaceae bacterium]